MSIKIMSAIWDGGPKGPTLRFVLIALVENAYDAPMRRAGIKARAKASFASGDLFRGRK